MIKLMCREHLKDYYIYSTVVEQKINYNNFLKITRCYQNKEINKTS